MNDRYPHILIPGLQKRFDYKSPKNPRSNSILPERDRETHSSFLLRKLNDAWRNAEKETAVYHTTRDGVYLEFKGSPGYELVAKSLEDMHSKKVRLCNIRTVNEPVVDDTADVKQEVPVTYATVYVSNEKRDFFLRKITQYATEIDARSEKPKNQKLIESISDIQKALSIESFWMDDSTLIPDVQSEWCEVWLRGSKEDVLPRFEEFLENRQIVTREGLISFPERVVKLVYVNREQLGELSLYSGDIAEYRKAKDTEAFWLDIPTREQAESVENLLERLQVDRESLISVCILDTGVNYGHPLLLPVLDSVDCHTCDPDWGINDKKGHGTLMAGLAAYGNLASHLAGTGAVIINHVLESVKILQTGKGNANK